MDAKMLRLDRLPLVIRDELSPERREWNERGEHQRGRTGNRCRLAQARRFAGAR